MACHEYSLFGLQVRSELALPELASETADRPADVVVRFGAVDGAGAGPGYTSSEAGTLLSVADIGLYLIRNGREIVIDAAPGASERNLRLFLLGSAFGALLHQRGLMPLHANAIDLGGIAVAFCGHSGAGKSTLAAWFGDRGHPILSDDVCVIGFDAAGHPLAQPGLRRLRLWSDALQATGRSAADFERSFDGLLDSREKYDVPIREGRDAGSVPLGAVYLLDRATEDRAQGQIVPLGGVDAVDALVTNTYRGRLLPAIGGAAGHLITCVRIAAQVPVFRAERRWGHAAFDAENRALADHARSIASPKTPASRKEG